MAKPSTNQWTTEEVAVMNGLAAPSTDRFSKLRASAFEAVQMAIGIINDPRNCPENRSYRSLSEKSIDEEIQATLYVEPSADIEREDVRARLTLINDSIRADLAIRKHRVQVAVRFLGELGAAIRPTRGRGRPPKVKRDVLQIVKHLSKGKQLKECVIDVCGPAEYERRERVLRTELPRFYSRVYEALRSAYPNNIEIGSNRFEPKFVTDGMIAHALEDWCCTSGPLRSMKDIYESAGSFRWAATQHLKQISKARK